MDDLISRQSVKDWLKRWDGYLDQDMIARMQYGVDHIPSVQPRKGKWEDETFKPWGPVFHPYKCDQCGEHSEAPSNFCPNCGAEMR